MKYCAVPVIQALPVISGMIAGVPPTMVSAAMRPVNWEPRRRCRRRSPRHRDGWMRSSSRRARLNGTGRFFEGPGPRQHAQPPGGTGVAPMLRVVGAPGDDVIAIEAAA